MSWLKKRVRIVGTDYEGLVVATILLPGQPPSLKVVRPAKGRRMPTGPLILSATEYLLEGEVLFPSNHHPGSIATLQALVVYEAGIEPCGPAGGVG